MQRIHRLLAILEVADVEIGEGMVHKANHGAVTTVRVLVNQPGDEVRCKGNDKGLVQMKTNTQTDNGAHTNSTNIYINVHRDG